MSVDPASTLDVSDSVDDLANRGGTVLRGFTDPGLAAYLCSYVQLQVHNSGLQRRDGGQVPGSVEGYGDPALDTLLGRSTALVSRAVGRPAQPTYSFVRVYRRGQELTAHTDRPACEYSVTVHLGASDPTPWPVSYRDLDGQDHHVELAVGDGVIYRGCDVTHWREPCPVEWYAQVFLHYVDSDGPHAAERFDRRAYLGLPAAK